MEQNHLRLFYNSLRDEPLTPDNPFYVPYIEGENDLIAQLRTQILWSEAASVNLFTGQRGSGKSTELRRLKQMLEDEGCIVFLADMSEYIHLTKPIEITDFLISIMAALSERVTERFGRDVLSQGYWERLTKFLQTEVGINEMQLKGGPVEIKASLKDDPSFKELLQKGLRGHVARLVRQSQEFVTEVVEFIRRETRDADRKVVYLIDSVEQIRGVGSEAEDVYKSVENLFSGHAGTLSFPLMHIVYTIPPFLIPLAPSIGARLGGGTVYSLPSVHIYDYRTREVDEKGIAVMERILDKRCSRWRDVFDPLQLRRMALSSGGDLRDFFRLMKQCLVK
ncbi:MAG: hypothetical protein HGA78_08250, partial [Nitrospirales bacterium]|nr:hypothetical protein [Nitrospirales bacterium]